MFAHPSEQLREVLGDLQLGANMDTHGGPYGTRKHHKMSFQTPKIPLTLPTCGIDSLFDFNHSRGIWGHFS